METENNNWHLSKSINVAHILVVMGLFVSGFIYVSDIKEDVALQGQQVTHNTEAIKSGRGDMNNITLQINTKLDKIFDMLYELGQK